ncbi:phosphotransferase family protein [Paenibacillus soyae]|uniref:Aminoglycoside phosphotransferase family protein n=1 Tax=Paenibacillus soyae TaxID=2969249 RepID=A0A9X2SAA4_9BACL|nr:aminoglycoside phosphotransferase family protein [Paenibacillus soyae]MCR2806016.1 aminoglycoside phosphotransferase family protein [Paenibacillus soyae]
MQNAAKSKLESHEIERIILHAFGKRPQETKELTDGWANSAYSILMSDGTAAVLKVAPIHGTKMMRYERSMMRTEVEVLRLLDKGGAVPVPNVLAYDDACTLVPSEYFIMEQLHGVPYNKIKESLSTSEKDAIESELGAYNRLINENRGTRFGYYAQEDSWKTTWAEAFQQMIMGVLADGKDAEIELPGGYSAIEAEIIRHADALSEVEQPSLVHWDLWEGNVFVDNGKISGLIDFERALWGDPLMEHFFSHFNRSGSFAEGYGRKVATIHERRRRALYDLYLDLILWIECTYRQYENKDHWNWARENMARGWERFVELKRL